MPKCPYCNSASHVVDTHQQYFETSKEAVFLHFYKCSLCRKTFRGTSVYSRNNYKTIKEDEENA